MQDLLKHGAVIEAYIDNVLLGADTLDDHLKPVDELPRRGVLPRGFCSATRGPTAHAPTKRLPHMAEGHGRREQYPTAGSAERGNSSSTKVSNSSPLGGQYVGEGPIAHPHQPPNSRAQGPRARPKAVSCRHPHLGSFSVGVTRLEEAGATGLACHGAHSCLLTRSRLRSPGGPGYEVVRCRRFVVVDAQADMASLRRLASTGTHGVQKGTVGGAGGRHA